MMDGSKSTLFIKSPNDKISSYAVHYEPSWLVKDLKQHLHANYPTHPPPSAQRLIYAGKLLSDEISLSAVFKTSSLNRTIHLVTRNSENNESSSDSTSAQSPNALSSLESISPSEMQQYKRDYYEYLRGFYLANGTVGSSAGTDLASSNPWPYPYHFPAPIWPFVPSWCAPGSQTPGYSYYPAPTCPAPTGVQVESNLAGDANPVHAGWGLVNQPNGDAPAAPADREPIAGIAQQPQQQQQQQQQAMIIGNPIAGGLMGADDMGENAGNFDIIDRFYMIFRLTLFIGLCFAYSSLDKAIIVFSVAAYVYFYNIYRRHAALRRAAAAAVAGVPEPPDLPQPDPSATDVSANPSSAAEHEATRFDDPDQQLRERSPNTDHAEQPAAPPIAPEPRLTRIAGTFRLVLSISFQFVSSLITSLIPEQPPPIRLD